MELVFIDYNKRNKVILNLYFVSCFEVKFGSKMYFLLVALLGVSIIKLSVALWLAKNKAIRHNQCLLFLVAVT